MATVIHEYLDAQDGLNVERIACRSGHHEWEIDQWMAGVASLPLGRIWVEDDVQEGKVVGARYGYHPGAYTPTDDRDYPEGLIELVEGGKSAVDAHTSAAKVEPDTPKPTDAPRKYGPSRYTDEEKIAAVVKWRNLDKGIKAVTLNEFLDAEFGNEGGVAHVSNSTFYGWRDKFRKHWE